MRASSSCREGEFAGMLRFCYDQYSNASTEKLREVWRRKFRDLERTFRMQRNIVSITVCTDLIEDSFTLPSFFILLKLLAY